MSEIVPVGAVTATQPYEFADSVSNTSSLGNMFMSGISAVENQSAVAADALANYAVGNEVPAHELMIAMEQARMSVQLTVEIRNRLVEAYQELSRMQI